MLYNKESKETVINEMMVNEIGTYQMYFNDTDGTFNCGLYTTGTVEDDEFYKHNHLVATSPTASDLSTWLGCFDCRDCVASGFCYDEDEDEVEKAMENCFKEQLEENIDFDIIRDAVMEVAKSVLGDDLNLILDIIEELKLKENKSEWMEWTFNDRQHYESVVWDNIIEMLEDDNVEYNGKDIFDLSFFGGDIVYICDTLCINFKKEKWFKEFEQLMYKYKFNEALNILRGD